MAGSWQANRSERRTPLRDAQARLGKMSTATHTRPPEPPQSPDPKDLQHHHSPELELALLRRGVRRMSASRWACSRCGRSPLVGERLHVFAPHGDEESICDLCMKKAPDGSFGDPVRLERVLAGERPLTVRRAAAA